MAPRLVTQRLACLERVLNPLECLSFSAELEERLALELEQVLLGDSRLMRQRSAGENPCERPAKQRVVVADTSGAPSKVDAELQCCLQVLAAHRDCRARRMRLIAFACAFNRRRLRIRNLTFAIHRDRVGLPKKSQFPRIGR